MFRPALRAVLSGVAEGGRLHIDTRLPAPIVSGDGVGLGRPRGLVKITQLDVHVLRVPFDRPVVSTRITIPNAYLIVVRLHSSEGCEGVGFGAVLKESYAKPLAGLIESLRDVVVGSDPTMCEAIWRDVDKAMFKAGPVGMSMWAVSVVDVAVWDLFGKLVGQPLYKVLGGRQTRLPCYPLRGLTHHSFEELRDEIDAVVQDGFRAIKVFVSGLLEGTGPVGVAKKLRLLKEQVGGSVRLGLDNQDYWSPADAIRLGRMIEDLDLFWFEEPVDHRDTDGIAAVAARAGHAGLQRRVFVWHFRLQAAHRPQRRRRGHGRRTHGWRHHPVSKGGRGSGDVASPGGEPHDDRHRHAHHGLPPQRRPFGVCAME